MSGSYFFFLPFEAGFFFATFFLAAIAVATPPSAISLVKFDVLSGGFPSF
jgi:hypothetical protein